MKILKNFGLLSTLTFTLSILVSAQLQYTDLLKTESVFSNAPDEIKNRK